MKSLESGDDQVMSAVMSGPPMLSGLSQSEVDAFALMWRTKRWSNEMARITQLEKALAAIQLGGT